MRQPVISGWPEWLVRITDVHSGLLFRCSGSCPTREWSPGFGTCRRSAADAGDPFRMPSKSCADGQRSVAGCRRHPGNVGARWRHLPSGSLHSKSAGNQQSS